MSITEDRINEIAEQILNDTGQNDVEKYLLLKKSEAAKNYLVGAIDRQWEEGKLDDEQARSLLTEINIPEKRATQMRQAHALKS